MRLIKALAFAVCLASAACGSDMKRSSSYDWRVTNSDLRKQPSLADAIYELSEPERQSVPETGPETTPETVPETVALASRNNRPLHHHASCYSCSDCPAVTNRTTRKNCPVNNAPHVAGKCVLYAEKYDSLDQLWWVRGCPQQLGSCEDIRHGHRNLGDPTLTHCLECEGDLCNASPPVAAALLSLLTPLLLKALFQ